MFGFIKSWFDRYFGDAEALILLAVLLVSFGVVLFLHEIFAPVLVALGIAYVLDGVITVLNRVLKLPRTLSYLLVYLVFILGVVALVLCLLPVVSNQLIELTHQLPMLLTQFQALLITRPKRFPGLFPVGMMNDIGTAIQLNASKLVNLSGWMLSVSQSSLSGLVTGMVYIFLVPLLVFFFLKDKNKLLTWGSGLMPKERGLTDQIFVEMKQQLGKYLRGKVFEMIIVGVVTYMGFMIFGLRYAPLLAFFVGVSVFIPYIGMVIVTIPVAAIGLLQWGASPDFLYMFLVYLIIQAIDGNILVPLLFSEAVDLHPVAIVIAILFFGGIWGFWGLFFAIPLATLVRAVVSGWYLHCNRNQFPREQA